MLECFGGRAMFPGVDDHLRMVSRIGKAQK